MWTAFYIASIVAINYGFSVVPLLELPSGDFWPPMSLAVGLVFVFRDFAQREVGHWIIPAMLAGGVISYFMADPYVAVASVCAFLVSEALDWAVYSFMKQPFHNRILLSSAVSTPADSIVFLSMIGLFGWFAVLLMTASKMVGALVVWRLARA